MNDLIQNKLIDLIIEVSLTNLSREEILKKNLIYDGIIDSMILVFLIIRIEEEFQVKLLETNLRLDQFEKIESILSLIKKP